MCTSDDALMLLDALEGLELLHCGPAIDASGSWTVQMGACLPSTMKQPRNTCAITIQLCETSIEGCECILAHIMRRTQGNFKGM